LADNIIQYRKEIGVFTNRKQLLQVPRLSTKAYEQCAGFLRIVNGDEGLDNSAVHPEAYSIVNAIATDENLTIKALIGNQQVLQKIEVKKYATEQIGTLTIQDILKELQKPGLDPRADAQAFEFANVFKIEEVQVGMELPGIVTNITRFGAFVDIGVKQDGLVHVSEIANKYITDPSEVLKLNQQVKVKVLEVDIERKRIQLSIKQTELAPTKKQFSNIGKQTNTQSNIKKEVPILDALQALKQKFSK
jgi:uncharacterized protein